MFNDCSSQLKEGEIFIANSDPNNLPRWAKGLKTVRVGTQAYDIDGHPLHPAYLRPLIVHKSEYATLCDQWNISVFGTAGASK